MKFTQWLEDNNLSESIKHIKSNTNNRYEEFQLGKLIIKIPDDLDIDCVINIGKEQQSISSDDLLDLCDKIKKFI